jgi:hypothetical protein
MTNTKPATKSRLLAKAPKAAEPSKPKILIFGKSGVGKTWTSLDFPRCYYIDTEDGANLSHYTDKLEKSGGVYMGQADGSLDFKTVLDQIKALATEEHEFKTLIIDSITKLFNSVVASEAERLGDKDAFGASKKPAIALMRQLINWISRLDMNVILIAHEKDLWGNNEKIGVTFDCWDKLEYELHLALNIQKRGDTRVAVVRKSRLTGFQDAAYFPWAYSEFAQRYGKDVMEEKAKAIVLATPEQVGEIKRLLENVKISEDIIEKWYTKAGVTDFSEMNTEQAKGIVEFLKGKIS